MMRFRDSAWQKRVETAGLAVLCLALAWLPASAQNTLFEETFDERTDGVLHQQNEWQAHRQNDAQVQTTTVYAGAKAGTISTNASVWRDFTNAVATNVWIDFYARVPHPADATPPALTGSVAAAFFVTDAGKIKVTDGGSWSTLNYTVSEDTWYRFSLNLDYTTEKWALYVADSTPNALATTVATNLSFSTSSTNTHFCRFRVRN